MPHITGLLRLFLWICKLYIYRHHFLPRFELDIVFTELGFDGTMFVVPVVLIGNGGLCLFS